MENQDNMAKEVTASEQQEEFNEFVPVQKPSILSRFVKRAFDIVSSGFGIVFLSWFFIFFSPIVAIAMKGNPFFVQTRVGKDEKLFPLIKYRSMTNAKDENGNLLPDDQRLTKFGRIMRKLSIDELPELFNIFFGQMSVVGPRPLPPVYLPYYNQVERQRFLVRPGLTGLAQVSGRNAISWEQRFAFDVEYIGKLSLAFDLKIIFLTVKKVLAKEDVVEGGAAVVESFHTIRERERNEKSQ